MFNEEQTKPAESLEFEEFETKYLSNDSDLIQFKLIVSEIPNVQRFIYVEGPDFYYDHPSEWYKANPQWDRKGTFIRYRKPSFGLDDNRRQLTWKYKPAGSKNNIRRKEHNIDVGQTPERVILEQLEDSGARFNFSVIKNCHIYNFHDATLVFYSVYDTTDGIPSKADYFIEIEVNEELIATLTAQAAWDIISKYETLLSAIPGVSPRKRLKQSLNERYRRKQSDE